jgi:hypothetical protein
MCSRHFTSLILKVVSTAGTSLLRVSTMTSSMTLRSCSLYFV